MIGALATIAMGGAASAGVLDPFGWFDDPALKVCEAFIQKRLVAPSTYTRISSSIFGSEVTVEYDAKNRMGVPLRESETCRFTYFDDRFWFEGSAYAEADDVYGRINAASAALKIGTIDTSNSALKPTPRDAAMDACAKEAARRSGGLVPYRGDLHFISSDTINPENNTVSIRSSAEGYKFPTFVTCRTVGGRLTINPLAPPKPVSAPAAITTPPVASPKTMVKVEEVPRSAVERKKEPKVEPKRLLQYERPVSTEVPKPASPFEDLPGINDPITIR